MFAMETPIRSAKLVKMQEQFTQFFEVKADQCGLCWSCCRRQRKTRIFTKFNQYQDSNMITQSVAASLCRPRSSLLDLTSAVSECSAYCLRVAWIYVFRGFAASMSSRKRETGITVMGFQALHFRWFELTLVYIVRPRGHRKAGEGSDWIAWAFRRAGI